MATVHLNIGQVEMAELLPGIAEIENDDIVDFDKSQCLRVNEADAVGGVGHDAAEQFFAFAQRLFGSASFGDVHDINDDVGFAIDIDPGRRQADSAGLAVASHPGAFKIDDVAVAPEYLDHPCPVVRFPEPCFKRGHAKQFVPRPLIFGEQPIIDVDDPAIGNAGDAGGHRRGTEGNGESLLKLGNGTFCFLAFGNVEDEGENVGLLRKGDDFGRDAD